MNKREVDLKCFCGFIFYRSFEVRKIFVLGGLNCLFFGLVIFWVFLLIVGIYIFGLVDFFGGSSINGINRSFFFGFMSDYFLLFII